MITPCDAVIPETTCPLVAAVGASTVSAGVVCNERFAGVCFHCAGQMRDQGLSAEMCCLLVENSPKPAQV